MSRSSFEPVRIGVIGLGHFGRQHALTLAALAEANLVALVARRQASLDALGEQLPGVRGWTDLDRAIAESSAEAWVVASPTATHVPIATRLLSAGQRVLLEKPISADLDEARSLAPLVAPDSSNLMHGHIVLFNSEFRQLQDEMRRHGPLYHIDCVRHRATANLAKHAGENPLHLTMVHDLYAVQALVDRAEPVRFSAQMHFTASGACDLALAQLQWEDGLIGTFAASFLTPPGMAAKGFDRMEVFGEGWAARIAPNPRPIEVWDDRARWPMELEIRADPAAATGMMAEELRCFCRVVRGLQAVPIGATYADAIQVQGWMDRLVACAMSAQRH